MNIEAQIRDLMARIQKLESSADTAKAIATALTIIAPVMAKLADIQAEVRQDLAAHGDEIAGLRRHMNDHLTSIRTEMLDQITALHPKAAK
ncbi:hypothetical protein ACFOY2_35955 [Nonomuraea purpurea]|uniref:Uncharacterized protein n=1 Tax=Nonomuraea purpurea TaxID=1849276 RepID=A0ABV8GKH7_9ACTN